MNQASKIGKTPSPAGAFIKRCAAALLLAVIVELMLLCLLAVIITKVDLPHSLYDHLALASAAISVTLAAFISGKRNETKGLVTGAAVGFIFFVFLLLLSLIFSDQTLSAAAIYKLVILVCCGGIGGYLGVSRAGKSALKKKKTALTK